MTIAVIKGPSSLIMESAIRLATNISAPNMRMGIAAWIAMIRPTRKLINVTRGNASAPAVSATRKASFHRIFRGCVSANKVAANNSPTNEIRVIASSSAYIVFFPISTTEFECW